MQDRQQQQQLAPQLIPPNKLDFSNTNEWPRWMKRFERYRITSGLDKQSEEYAFMQLVTMQRTSSVFSVQVGD